MNKPTDCFSLFLSVGIIRGTLCLTRFSDMKYFITMCLSALSLSLGAQNRFTYDDLSAGMFSQRTVHGFRSMNDGLHYTTREKNKIVKYSYATGEQQNVIFEAPEGFGAFDYEFSADEKKILLMTDAEPIYRHSFVARYRIFDMAGGTTVDLSPNGKQQCASFSPDGRKVAFVRNNDLFYVDLETMKEVRITHDGRFNYILNGIPDWVYEEEFTFSQAYQWSPSSDRIAYYRFDEERVKSYPMNRFDDQLYPTVYSFKYPKAGEENSIVTIHSYKLSDATTRKMDVGEETDQYIPRIKWVPDGRLAIFRLNRHQNNFDMLVADPETGATKVVYNEQNSRYVERIDDETITFLSDGKHYIVKSEKDGFFHLYLYSFDKGQLNRITSGDWEVTQILGVDETAGLVYYLSTETSPLRRNLYAVKLNGKGKKRLTEGDGTYNVVFSKGYHYFISYFSNATTPNTVTLHASDGSLVRMLEDNTELKSKLKELNIPVKEFFTFKTSEGVELNGYLLKPENFDPAKQYPLLITQYSGPGSQRAGDTWGMDWEDVLVQQGYIVACVDGRGTGFRGEEFKKCTYKQLGKYEVIDQIEAAKHFKTLPYVDSSRMAIYGWSYGGFMALNCILKGEDVFKVAVAVAPVTNWRYYDTIYTELYNGLPQENPEGYDENSPIFFADRLKGKLLIAHGAGDDNVHVQNTYEMIDRFVKADKPFEMYIYPDKNHGMAPGARKHLMNRCIEFINRNL